MAQKQWKDFLLKSSLPLEYEVARLLESQGYKTGYDYSYTRKDENDLEKVFSFDVNAVKIDGAFAINLMIECKYRHPTTKWIFLPEKKEGYLRQTDVPFLHYNDSLSQRFALLSHLGLGRLEIPLTSKGIEITDSGDNPKTLHQAVYQLSYAFAGNIIAAFQKELATGILDSKIHIHVPLIITTAELYCMRRDVTIKDIADAESIENVAAKRNHIILKTESDPELMRHNKAIFGRFLEDEGVRIKEIRKDSYDLFENDLNELAKGHLPKAMIILQMTDGGEPLTSLLKNIADSIKGDKDLNQMLDAGIMIYNIIKAFSK